MSITEKYNRFKKGIICQGLNDTVRLGGRMLHINAGNCY